VNKPVHRFNTLDQKLLLKQPSKAVSKNVVLIHRIHRVKDDRVSTRPTANRFSNSRNHPYAFMPQHIRRGRKRSGIRLDIGATQTHESWRNHDIVRTANGCARNRQVDSHFSVSCQSSMTVHIARLACVQIRDSSFHYILAFINDIPEHFVRHSAYYGHFHSYFLFICLSHSTCVLWRFAGIVGVTSPLGVPRYLRHSDRPSRSEQVRPPSFGRDRGRVDCDAEPSDESRARLTRLQPRPSRPTTPGAKRHG